MYELTYQVSGSDVDELIFRSDCVEDLTVCIYTFWKSLNFEIPYFRFLDIERGCIKLDFGQYTRFYKIQYPKDESWNVIAGKMNDKLQVLKAINKYIGEDIKTDLNISELLDKIRSNDNVVKVESAKKSDTNIYTIYFNKEFTRERIDTAIKGLYDLVDKMYEYDSDVAKGKYVSYKFIGAQSD